MGRRARLATVAGLACWLLVTASCARAPHIVIPAPTGMSDSSLSALLAAHPLPDGQNISALPLGKSEALSYHLVQIRDREGPHIHATHDLVVTLLRGKGQLYVRREPQEMHQGDVAVVAHGTPHYFVNTDSEPAAAFVTFAPPYDGSDQVPLEAAP